MSIESQADWAGLREVGRIVGRTLDLLQDAAVAGTSTGALDRLAASFVRTQGARSAPAAVYGFPGTVLISLNDEVVHGIPGPRRLRDGDIVKIDVTLAKDGYVADAARTLIVGAGTGTARAIAQCARDAFEAALGVSTVGARVNEIGRAVSREVRRQGFTVVRGLCGHGVGRAIHEAPEVPNEYHRHQQDVLTEGLVLTIEPMISAGSGTPVQEAHGWTIRTADGSLAAHYEHTLVFTREGPVILTAS